MIYRTLSPVLFMIFNRPDLTSMVMQKIRAARPSRLYIAADGPRADHLREEELCSEARRVACQVDWPCEVFTLFRDNNEGCKRAVSGAITWFFENENEGIVLEDDCLPAIEFFRFCDEMLERYRLDMRVMTICGSSYASESALADGDYYFSYFADIWGWASWRRSWDHYDADLARWPEFKRRGGLQHLASNAPWREPYWARYFDATAQGSIDTWDYQWIFTVIERNGLACYPRQNLISNIGFRRDATHTRSESDAPIPEAANIPHGTLKFPLVPPHQVNRSELVDRQIEAKRLNMRPRRPLLVRVLAAAFRYTSRAFRLRDEASLRSLKSRPRSTSDRS